MSGRTWLYVNLLLQTSSLLLSATHTKLLTVLRRTHETLLFLNTRLPLHMVIKQEEFVVISDGGQLSANLTPLKLPSKRRRCAVFSAIVG
jgi:hypothetical protein